ncbi:MAG: hypothetical protein ACL93V_11185 [Candidatus Electrothrix sp. YB6]
MVIGIGLFLLGLLSFSTRTGTEFDGKTFRYRQVSIFPCFRDAWDEPLSEYEGVLARSEYHSDSDGFRYTLYIIELMHRDEQRRITLWLSRNNSSGHRERWEAYSRQFGLRRFYKLGDLLLEN